MLLSTDRREDQGPARKMSGTDLVEHFEAIRVQKDGTVLNISVVLAPVRNDRGEIRGLSATCCESTRNPLAIVHGANGSKNGNLLPANGNFAKVSVGAGKRPKVLLATAGAGGTIAAVRKLSESGFDVGVISSERLASAAWSNRAARSYSAPPESDGERFLEWLMATGAAEPGQVLLPTSDQTSWLYTVNASMLERYFRVYQPSVACMGRILDKKQFGDAVVRAGLSILPSWEPRNMDELLAVASTLPYPILIKPRTHVHRLRNDKGLVAHSREEMIEKYQQYVDLESVRAAENPLLPDAGLPILQQFVDVSKEGVYSVSGFLDRSGEHFVTRRSIKVFQRSHPVGVGICFESRPAAPDLSAAVRRLCKELEYFGMFEVEFIRFGDSWAAIDFNPRLFNQVGLDIRRGMPLPLFACLDAIGDTKGLREAIASAKAVDEDAAKAVFCDRFTMRSILIAKTLTGRISRVELATWRDWWNVNEDRAVDFALDRQDRMPGLIHVVSEIYLGLKAFPKFLKLTPKNALKAQLSLRRAQS